MESTFKRSLDDSSPPPAAPAASTSEPAAKRPRTSQPSGVPGIEDVPVDKAERDAFFSVTSNHFAMGAVPVIDRVKQLEDQERMEVEQVMTSSTGDIPTAESDDGEDDLQSSLLPSHETTPSQPLEADAMNVDGVPVESSASSTSAAIIMDERVTAPVKFLCQYWREHVSIQNSPKFELGQSTLDKTFGCTLHLHLPPSGTRTFTVPATYDTKKEAKEAVSRVAIKHGMLEIGKKAKEEAGEKPQERKKADVETVDNPMHLLHQAYQRFMPVALFTFDYSFEELNNVHGVTLTIPITSTLTKVYTEPPIYSSRKEPKENAVRQALRDGVIALMEKAFKERLVVETGGYISFNGGEAMEDVVDASVLLNREAKAYLGGTKAIVWTNHSSEVVPAPEGQPQPFQTYGATLEVHLNPTTTRTFSVDPVHPSKSHARLATTAAALKAGIVEEMKLAKKGLLPGGPPQERKEKKVIRPVPRAGTINPDEYAEMDYPVAYLHDCLQQWTASRATLEFELTTDPTTANKNSAKLTIILPPSDAHTFSVPAEYPTKKHAKEAVVRAALTAGVIESVRPKTFDARGAGAGRGRGGAMGGRGAPAFRVGRGAMRGGGGFGAGGGFGEGFGGSPQGFQQGRQGFGGPQGGFPQQQPYFGQQQQQHFGVGGPQGFGGQQGFGQGGWGQQGPPPPSLDASTVKHFDDFCQGWMGPGYLPSYDVRQNPQTGKFGAVVRLHITPTNTKAYWVDHDYFSRTEAEEAVARLAIQDGVLDAVKREFPRNFPPSQFPTPPLQQQPQQPFNNRPPNFRPPLPPQGAPGTGFIPFQQVVQQRQGGVPPVPRQQRPVIAPPRPVNALPKAKPVRGPTSQQNGDDSETPRDGKKKGENHVGLLNQACQILLGSSADKRPLYVVSEDPVASKFGCTLTVPLGDKPMSFNTPAIHGSKREAKEAVASVAMAQNVVNSIKDTVARDWSKDRPAVAAPVAVPADASSSAGPSTSAPAQALPSTSSTANGALAASATPARVDDAATTLAPPPVVVASSASAPTSTPALETDASAPAPHARASNAAAGGPSRQTSAKPAGHEHGAKSRRSAILQLEEYCQANDLKRPEFSQETGTGADGQAEEQVLRVWVVLGDLKFELPNPKEKDGKERLAGRVLKHLLKEKAAKA